MGFHQMLPPPEVSANMTHPEAPPTHPKGPNTNFQYPTPMPFRFREGALSTHNAHQSKKRQEHPIYETSANVIGRLAIQNTDLHMRWYGIEGEFTSTWNSALPKTRVSTGLNTAMDYSDIHHTMDQGWSGNLGLTDFNVANRENAKHVVRPTRKP